MNIYYLIIIFSGLLVLIGASGLAVRALYSLGLYLKVKEYLIIFLLLGFATVLPELFIGINGAMQGIPEISFGLAIGTSIVSLTILAGIIAIFSKSFKTNNFFKTKDLSLLSLLVLVLIFLAFDGNLSRIDGIILLGVFFISIIFIFQNRFQFSTLNKKIQIKKVGLHFFILVISIIAMFLASSSIVSSSIAITNEGFSIFLLAIAVIAPLSAIPELLVELNIVKNNKTNMSFGDLFTSVIFNLSLVVGLVAFINPFTILITPATYLSLFFLIFSILLFNFFVRSKDALEWYEGVFLLSLYLVYIGALIVTASI